MRSYLEAVVDGVVTGSCLAIAVIAWGWVAETPLSATGARLFMIGLAVIGLAMLLRIGDAADPPGLVGLLRGHRANPPATERHRLGAFRWIDRLVPVDSPWLVAGFTVLATAFLPPFLGL
jgi:hypothetical protein